MGIDLTGNLVLDLSLKLDQHSLAEVALVDGLWRKTTAALEPGPPRDVSLRFVRVKVPTIPAAADGSAGAVSARLHLAYQLRHVVSGHRSNAEGDDEVEFLEGEHPCSGTPLSISPVEPAELQFSTWGINREGDRTLVLAVNRLRGKRPHGEAVGLLFQTAEAAEEFLSWLLLNRREADQRRGVPPYTVAGRSLYLCPWDNLDLMACRGLVDVDFDELQIGRADWNFEELPQVAPQAVS